MKILEAISVIESHAFAARYSIHSSFCCLLEDLEVSEEFSSLANSGDLGASTVLDRVSTLSQFEIDLNFVNPWDFSLAVYLLVLNKISLPMAKAAAQACLATQNLWLTNFLLPSILLKDATSQPATQESIINHEVFQYPFGKTHTVSLAGRTSLLAEKPLKSEKYRVFPRGFISTADLPKIMHVKVSEPYKYYFDMVKTPEESGCKHTEVSSC